MPGQTSSNHFVLIQIEGMHCHKCEASIQRILQSHPGVREVEVDFASGQASVIYDEGAVSVNELMNSVAEAGYKTNGFSLGQNAS